jgi:hypothetical protein
MEKARATMGMIDHVPYRQQKWMYDALSHQMIHELINFVLFHYEGRILEEGKKRLEEGYNLYGSEMYHWTPQHRLSNVIEELVDAVIYMTSGPLPKVEEEDS